MPDKHTVVFGAMWTFMGALIVSIGNAFGFSSRLSKNENAVDKCQTLVACGLAIEASKELVGSHLDHHSERIGSLEKSQNEGFKVVYEKLDKLISIGRMD